MPFCYCDLNIFPTILLTFFLLHQGWDRCSITVSAGDLVEVIEKSDHRILLQSVREIRPIAKDIQFTPFAGEEHNKQLSQHLLKYEAQMISTYYKFGVLYCKDNQTDENEMYSNRTYRNLAALSSLL